MRKLVFATNNRHKLNEIRSLLHGQYEILSLLDIGCTVEIPETGDTLEENSRIKARHVYREYGMDCFADDTGLEIEALGGRPGVFSARYAGEDCNPENNIIKVLDELEGKSDRRARFRTVICLIAKGEEYVFEGVVNGKIIEEKRGAEGFGYDPVFVPEGHDTTFAEMPLAVKNMISHRAKAMKELIAWLLHQG